MSDPEYDDEYYDEDDAVSEGGMEGMDPDHPLLARAQAALKKQLLATRLDLDEKIREKNEELGVSHQSVVVVAAAAGAAATPDRRSGKIVLAGPQLGNLSPDSLLSRWRFAPRVKCFFLPFLFPSPPSSAGGPGCGTTGLVDCPAARVEPSRGAKMVPSARVAQDPYPTPPTPRFPSDKNGVCL